MNRHDLTALKNWFSDYCKSFYSADEEDRKNISLKEQHTFNVCMYITRIARELMLNENEMLIAETVGLFHDIGRFQQYAEYKTFRDSISVNHATLGTTILAEKGVLRGLSEKEQRLILEAIKFHNVYTLPDIQDSHTMLFMKLIRDADKLDIWRVVIEYYDAPDEDKASAVGLGLPERPGYSEEVMSYIFKGKIATLSSVKSLNDLKLMQLSWIFDLNFGPSLKVMLERDYMNRILKTLPRTGEIAKVPFLLQEYIDTRLKERRCG